MRVQNRLLEDMRACDQQRDDAFDEIENRTDIKRFDLINDDLAIWRASVGTMAMGVFFVVVRAPKPAVRRTVNEAIATALLVIGGITFHIGTTILVLDRNGESKAAKAIEDAAKKQRSAAREEFKRCMEAANKKQQERDTKVDVPVEEEVAAESRVIDPWHIRIIRHFEETGYPVANQSTTPAHIGGFGRREDRVEAIGVPVGFVVAGGAVALGLSLGVKEMGKAVLAGLRGLAPAL